MHCSKRNGMQKIEICYRDDCGVHVCNINYNLFRPIAVYRCRRHAVASALCRSKALTLRVSVFAIQTRWLLQISKMVSRRRCKGIFVVRFYRIYCDCLGVKGKLWQASKFTKPIVQIFCVVEFKKTYNNWRFKTDFVQSELNFVYFLTE